MEKKYERLLAERDIIGTQLVKKNDELGLYQTKIKFLQNTLHLREKALEQHAEDINLLKLEIQRLRHEKELLSKGVENMSDLRQELFILERDLNDERIRARALEELIKTPQNIHRWRKLEENDPSTLELLDKVRMLQKQCLDKSQKIKELESGIIKGSSKKKEAKESPFQHLSSKEEIHKLKKKLMLKNEKTKSLVAELKMRESQITVYERERESQIKSVKEFNFICNQQKQKEGRSCESAPVKFRAIIKPAERKYSVSPKRYLGGGFNLTPKRESSTASKKEIKI